MLADAWLKKLWDGTAAATAYTTSMLATIFAAFTRLPAFHY